MVKVAFLYIFFTTVLFASSLDIKRLQKDFYDEVIVVNIYKKRFGTFIKRTCLDDDLVCVKKTIKRLASWPTVKKDKSLKSFFAIRNTRIKIDKKYWQKVIKKLKHKKLKLLSSQFVSVVDLDKQLFMVLFWDNSKKKFYLIGSDLISSGNIEREKEVKLGEDHYMKTPSGIFCSQVGWRSDGKYSEDNRTLGYGSKNRYVFYFGKQKTVRYNTFDKNLKKIDDPSKWSVISDELNFAVHSHKSSKPMGEPYSHGCIRMTDEFNRFLDDNLILHKNMFQNNKWKAKYTLAPKNMRYKEFAGEYLIVFNNIK